LSLRSGINQTGAESAKLDNRTGYGVVDLRQIGDMDKTSAIEQWPGNRIS